jgi:polyhydroxyalkanoate synthesis regulator phasin
MLITQFPSRFPHLLHDFSIEIGYSIDGVAHVLATSPYGITNKRRRSRMNLWHKSALLLATGALVGGALFAGVVYAQTAVPTPTPQGKEAPAPVHSGGGWFGGRMFGRFFGQNGGWFMGHFGGRGMGPGGRGMGPGMRMGGPLAQDRQAILAEALGMTTDELQKALDEGKSVLAIAQAQGLDESKLQAAVQAAAVKHIDQAVKDGDLAANQADQLKERLKEGMPFFGPEFGMGGKIMGEILGNPQDLLAEATGMTPDALQAAIKGTVEKRLKAAVEAGKITQPEADRLLQQLDKGLLFFGGPMAQPSQ